MIALLTKDILTLKKVGVKFAIILALYAVIFSSSGGVAFLSAFIIIFSAMLIVNAFAYDELSKWDTYALSLPVTKKQIVLSRYLLGILFDTAGFLISILLALAARKLDSELSLIIYCFFAGSLFIMALMMPLLYKFGTQKARIWLIVLFLAPTAGAALLKNLGINFSALSSISNATAELLTIIFLPAALLLYIGSYFLSCWIFQNKEI
ncbi:ABC-2 transporter permease [Caproiciproducens galactitolivorans]|uniref:ABC-2 transporter permease n=1 Tax=Caproiciproducens galactitolivorans TaxID=642589 RepID=A0ABT4BWC5_9FIRM|nr:ABC-2 transporter permease [Caproiciproducens galactitolivorans]MCY1715080.1 ABC-2 transporter permease [Caproiciproducens galactitolivorans]